MKNQRSIPRIEGDAEGLKNKLMELSAFCEHNFTKFRCLVLV